MTGTRGAGASAAALVAVAVALAASPSSAAADTPRDRDGLVYRHVPGVGERFHPLMSFAELNRAVSLRRTEEARRMARALVARGVTEDRGLVWEYDFAFGGGAAGWRSGFVQAVAAQALARAGVLLADPALRLAADAAFRGLRRSLLMRLGGGVWVLEYGFTRQAILNAQLQSAVSLDTYARIAGTAAARRTTEALFAAARRLLPQFDLGCRSRYQLGGGAATAHYHAYHVQLLARIAAMRREPIWRATRDRWKPCAA